MKRIQKLITAILPFDAINSVGTHFKQDKKEKIL